MAPLAPFPDKSESLIGVKEVASETNQQVPGRGNFIRADISPSKLEASEEEPP
jgi:hypothetical protein